MKQETTTISLNEPLCKQIEEFLQEHPEHGTLEEFVTGAGRIRRQQLTTLPKGPAPESRDQDYSHGAVEAAWHALNKPLTSEEKTRIVKDLAQEIRKLRGGTR